MARMARHSCALLVSVLGWRVGCCYSILVVCAAASCYSVLAVARLRRALLGSLLGWRWGCCYSVLDVC